MKLGHLAPITTLGVFSIILQNNPWPCQLPWMIAKKLFSEAIFLVDNLHRLKQLTWLLGFRSLGLWGFLVLERLCPNKSFTRGNLANDIIPRRSTRDPFRGKKLCGSLVNSKGPKVVSSHDELMWIGGGNKRRLGGRTRIS